MKSNWIIYLELARDFFTQWGIFRKRTPAEQAARDYQKTNRQLNHEAEGYRKDYAKGRIDRATYMELSEGIISRRLQLNAEYDAG